MSSPPRDPTAPTAGGASPAGPRRTGPSRYPARAHKTRERKQDGYKAHVEVEPDTGLMPMAKLTKASGSDSSDAAVGAELVSADPTIDQTPDVEVLGDSAYATGDMLHQLDEKKWKPLLKPWPIKPVVEGGFTIDDYTYDPDTNTLTCPAGVTRPVSPARRVSFKAACRGCPLRKQCTTSATGRLVLLGEHHQLQREHRQRATDSSRWD